MTKVIKDCSKLVLKISLNVNNYSFGIYIDLLIIFEELFYFQLI